jgi:predicted molibdopterin-dependent oxidoreductase YjgC
MVVRTATPRVTRNRQFILSLHLADTLQERELAEDNNPSRLHDLAERYGTSGQWTPVDSPRQGRPSDDNPYIQFRPDRCIACSLCTRYCDQIEAVSAITLAFKGARTTISTADERPLTDTTCELCGGCIDVCPTGAMTEKAALAWGKPERDLEKVRTTCNFCGVGCQVDLNVDRSANRVVKVTSPPPGTTVNDGNLCVKGRFANDFIHHPDRLRDPLIRSESGELVPASWDVALDRVSKGLLGVADEHGSDSLAFISSSRCTSEENYLMQKLARSGLRTHNIHQCAAT